ncbi:Thiol:disulfide interchange protein DsbD [Flavobacterium fryxellicola]|uniref:Thiol:disulfide interchange protein n=1 Tax=Flavobacterium fryxellicola TaxID=249352 RepID=A0A167ZFB1_9FLAO|nr:thioredoxin family protein [Flavobacterium fryxellicola]OAB30387.1 thiol:disulfide interchange protein [Flavobacterium fryxellicola]SHN76189.1 Thiol:disulfide interchange protein DsbD [Flavobacterium fryxellicola]
MKKLLFILIAFLAFANGNAQILDPAKWTTKIEKKSETNYLLTFNAVIENDWHLYSQFTPDGGPLPLEIIFKNQKGNFTLVGKAKESKTRTAYNDIFEVNETFFEKKGQIQQEITITNPKLREIKVDFNYQVCKDVCINIEKNFTFTVPAVSIATTAVDVLKSTVATADTVAATPVASSKMATQEEVVPLDSKPATKRGLWSIFFIAFLSGFAALLTPCVFPMIPMTVSFFTKQSKTKAKGIRNAIIYGIAIIFIYVVLGFLVTWIFGADALNALSTNVWFNIIFFVLLVTFAASFLGAFEIMLPNSWANKVDNQADRGGIIGILFMALALAIVSFSCTGPIVGTLLVEAASKGGIAPIVGMFGFSLALALPFMLFAMFPGWLNSLPKSGGWLNTVKVVLGFLELALAFKFLSNADLVLQLHFLEREVFLAIWIAIFGTLAFYLFGKITLPHDSPMTHISVGRLSFGLVVLAFTIYLIPGIWGAPLKLISGFPPPMTYSESPYGVGNSKGSSNATAQILPEGAHLGPHDLIAFEDYEKGLAYAKSVNKPILLDFTGYACVNCRKMEDYVWSDPAILKILQAEVVLISLYVDDKRELPKSEQYVSKETGKEIVSIGNKWSDFQITKFKANAQPYYIILDTEGIMLSDKPESYNSDINAYKGWLREGIDRFEKVK